MPLASLPRLRSVVHMAVPPVIVLVLTSVAVSDRVFGLGKLAGGALPPRVRGGLRAAYVASNAALVTVAVAALAVQCRTSLGERSPDVTADASCYPTVTLAAVALLVMLFVDRAWLNVLDAPGASPGAATRAIHGTTVVAVFMALSKPKDAHVFPLLLLAACNRASGMLQPPGVLRVARAALRVACAWTGLEGLYAGGASRQTAALSIVCAALSR